MSAGRSSPRERAEALARLAELTGREPRQPELFLQALTHPSYANEHPQEMHNQRLEFLGDAALGLVVAEELYRRFPDKDEGDLTRMRAAVVCTPTLARVARRLDLGRLLRLGQGEEGSGGRQRSSLLADALEAVIGALMLEGGLETVRDFVFRHLSQEMEEAAAGSLVEDFKTFLQEEGQRRFRADPVYRVVGEEGPDHNKSFTVEVLIQGKVMGTGTGRSKKEAEQAAAEQAVARLQATAP
ncbi:MAG TPA: ribonuclease III [Sphingobacteriaceae bacterium]|nr:ribonuclease III [Sphingobacteriaceae bacterium]